MWLQEQINFINFFVYVVKYVYCVSTGNYLISVYSGVISSLKECGKEKEANDLLAWIRKWVSAPWTAVISILFFSNIATWIRK